MLQWFGAAAAEPTAMDPGWPDLLAHHSIRKMAATGALSARLVLAADLRLFTHRAREPLAAAAGRRVAIASRDFAATPAAAAETLARAEEALGGPVLVAPAAPAQRLALASLLPFQPLTAEDWPPVVAPGPPAQPRVERPSRPAIGFYRASAARPWPATSEALRAVLPEHPLVARQALGAPERLAADLAVGETPAEMHPAGTDPAVFLAGLDLLVCPDRPEDDPYPEEALAALVAGTPPALAPGYRASFLSAAVYLPPERLADRAIDVLTNPALVADLRTAGRELLATRFAPKAAVARVVALIGPPAAAGLTSRAGMRPEATILSLSSNGVGMGHLVRQIAVATRLERHFRPVFLGFSQAVGLARDYGYPAEHLPYHHGVGLNTAHWNAWLAAWLDSACRFYAPRAFVLDANVPFAALDALRGAWPGLPMIWVRRAMWGEGRDRAAVEKAQLFDLVIEPGELAAAYDSGTTAAERAGVRQVDPIVLTDAGDQLPRVAAVEELGLEADTLNVLLLPGAQNNFDAGRLWTAILDELGTWPRTRVVLGEWAISEAAAEAPPFVLRRRGFPYARWFRAFDFAVSAAGYNSFAELTALGLPAVFVPNENPLMDRQDLRARFAERRRLGLRLAVGDLHRVRATLARMRDPEERAGFRARLAALDLRNGAPAAAALVAEWAEGGLAHRPAAWL